jgi:hypothetical protein
MGAGALCYGVRMKLDRPYAALIPQALRREIELQLHKGETLAGFVEESVRLHLERREHAAPGEGHFHSADNVSGEVREDLPAKPAVS